MNTDNYDLARSALDALLDDEANGQDRPLIEHRALVHSLLAIADAIRDSGKPAPEVTSSVAFLDCEHDVWAPVENAPESLRCVVEEGTANERTLTVSRAVAEEKYGPLRPLVALPEVAW